ncbi:MAG: AbrB family transcriptional regulator [Clostridium sp.]
MTLYFFITMLVALIGGMIFKKNKFPAGLMVGAMLCVGGLNVITGNVYVPSSTRFFVQVIAGSFIGMTMDKDKFKQLKTVMKPAIVMIIGLIIINITLGVFVYFSTDMNLVSSLFSTVPGGMTDVSIISQEMGADTARTAIFQLARLIFVVTFFPLIIKAINKKLNGDNTLESLRETKPAGNIDEELSIANDVCGDANEPDVKNELISSEFLHSSTNTNKIISEISKDNHWKELILTLLVALISGKVGKVLGVPAGAMLFSLIGITTMKVFTNKGYISPILKQGAQIFAGAYIGSSITLDVILGLRFVILPIIFLMISYTVLCMTLGYLISKWFKIDLITALFACTPAGASDMALIATDIGAVGSKVALFQVIRLISVIALFPGIIKVIVSIF